MHSVVGHEIPMTSLSEIVGCNGWNLYPTTKHATVALTHTVRRELAAIKSPIRITVSCDHIEITPLISVATSLSSRCANTFHLTYSIHSQCM